MRTGITTFGILLLLLGLVWAGQGANLIGGSFMTGEPTWLWIGVATAIAGVGLIWWSVAGYRRFP